MILCIGEILADMIGNEINGVMTFERYPGGAPFNVCVGIHNLGVKSGFIGSVGNDLTGVFLNDYVKSLNLYYDDIYTDNMHNTTLAFVANDASGERSFCFNRKNTADYQFNYSSFNAIKDFDIICLGSLMLSEKKGIEAADRIVELTKKYNKILCFDVNYRDDIYNSKEEAKDISLKYVSEANVVKFSEEEIALLSGEENIDEGVKKITNSNQLVLVTLGAKGSRFYYHNMSETIPTIKINPVDTTGAGDAFYAGVLAELVGKSFDKLEKEELISILKKANICGAMACLKKGALSSLPPKKEIEDRLNN